jgi:hypothetical protein
MRRHALLSNYQPSLMMVGQPTEPWAAGEEVHTCFTTSVSSAIDICMPVIRRVALRSHLGTPNSSQKLSIESERAPTCKGVWASCKRECARAHRVQMHCNCKGVASKQAHKQAVAVPAQVQQQSRALSRLTFTHWPQNCFTVSTSRACSFATGTGAATCGNAKKDALGRLPQQAPATQAGLGFQCQN